MAALVSTSTSTMLGSITVVNGSSFITLFTNVVFLVKKLVLVLSFLVGRSTIWVRDWSSTSQEVTGKALFGTLRALQCVYPSLRLGGWSHLLSTLYGHCVVFGCLPLPSLPLLGMYCLSLLGEQLYEYDLVMDIIWVVDCLAGEDCCFLLSYRVAYCVEGSRAFSHNAFCLQ